jgi:hypothetical protein
MSREVRMLRASLATAHISGVISVAPMTGGAIVTDVVAIQARWV